MRRRLLGAVLLEQQTQAVTRRARSAAAPATAKMISAVVFEPTRRVEACDDDGLLEPRDDSDGGEGFPAGNDGAPWELLLDGAGGGEGPSELVGAGEDELAVGGDGGGDKSGDGGGAADGGGAEELDDMTGEHNQEGFKVDSTKVVLRFRSPGGQEDVNPFVLPPSHWLRKIPCFFFCYAGARSFGSWLQIGRAHV